MNETESKTIEREPDEHDVLEQRPWRNGLSAPWLFTYGLVFVQLVTLPFGWGSAPSPMSLVLLVIYFFFAANLSLAAIVPIWWVVIRRWEFVVLGIAVLAANGVLLAIIAGSDLTLFLLPTFICGAVGVPLSGISWFWGRFDKPNVDGETVQFQEGLKFGIHHLFIASAVVAVICGIGKALAPYFVVRPASSTYILAVITTIISFNTLMSTWALMGRSVGLRVVIALLLAVLSCVGGSLAFPPGGAPWIFLMFGLCWAATTVHLALLRRSGLRFIKKQPNPEIARSL